MDSVRQKRKEDIHRDLTFIQSSLPYPEPERYEDFLTRLVCNLLDEGNASFKDKDVGEAVKVFSEGLSVTDYATSQEIKIPEALWESLYVNRATAYHSMGEYVRGVHDCDCALKVCKDSCSALYRKALCLKELGRYKEAYNCTTDYLLITRLDKQVNELAQELAVHLGLKNRKPYISTKVSRQTSAGWISFSPLHEEEPFTARGVPNGNMTAHAVADAYLGNGLNPLSGIAPVGFPSMPQSLILVSFNSMTLPSSTCGAHGSFIPVQQQQPVPISAADLDPLGDSELMGEDLDSLLDCFPIDPEPTETHIQAAFPDPRRKPTSSLLPAPTPHLPPAFFNSVVGQLNSPDTVAVSRGEDSPTLDALDVLSTSDGLDSPKSGQNAAPNTATLDTLDSLDSLDNLLDSPLSADAVKDVNEPGTEPDTEEKSLDEYLDCLDTLESVSGPAGRSCSVPKRSVDPLDLLDSLDALDSFPPVEGVRAPFPAVVNRKGGLDSLSDFSVSGMRPSHSAAAPVAAPPKNNHKEKIVQESSAICNPLSFTHDFKQACATCYPREGQSIYSFVHKPDFVHSCKRDILLCRRKADRGSEWSRVRPIPTWNSFTGPFVLCRELLKSGDLGLCTKYREKCSFAFNQVEIDVWTEERKGTLDRNLLFETAAVKLDPALSVIRLLQEYKGTFMFLCQECYDSKPRIISTRRRDNQAVCSNLHAPHTFDANKCMAYVVTTTTVNYTKIRPLNALCLLQLCCQALRCGCQREDHCHFAHSVIELKTWRAQRDTGITPDEIVKESMKYYEKGDQSTSKMHKFVAGAAGGAGGAGSKPRGGGKSLNLTMTFLCAQCWRDGQFKEPDNALKYCTATARHPWIKERAVLLVKSTERNKWVHVRPPPLTKKNVMQYEICTKILETRKCNYIGNCTFAHSHEEKELWTFMKNNDLKEMQQMYDMWLSHRTRQSDGATLAQTGPTQPVPLGEKAIVMPTDYADPVNGFYCPLCGKHSNSERQWQKHISTEKHKDRVFSCEGEDEVLTWNYRFPSPRFEICPKLARGCPEGASCDFAHSLEELQEWLERRDFLRRKLARARADMLIMPDEVDFGKYNFLLQD
ncbi:zinc finger CCCH domain-containing protein 7B-like [Diretmus argenteus]